MFPGMTKPTRKQEDHLLTAEVLLGQAHRILESARSSLAAADPPAELVAGVTAAVRATTGVQHRLLSDRVDRDEARAAQGTLFNGGA